MTHDTPPRTCSKCGVAYPLTSEYWHRDKARAQGFRTACKACVAECNRKYREANREELRERYRKWREENSEKERERHRKYREANREKVRERTRKWQEANPEKSRANNHRRRARKRKAIGNHTAKDVRMQYKAQRGKCWHCGCDVGDDYHVDHLVPLARGGTNAANNIVIACPTCNISKNDKLPHEWNGRLF